MDHFKIIGKLNHNLLVFERLFENKTREEYIWKQKPDKWCLLEIVCHLIDEEKEDFKARVQSILKDPNKPLAKFNPLAWVKERKYLNQDYEKKVAEFRNERKKSIDWLRSLKNPLWKNAYQHPKQGVLSAEFFLANWLAHDFLHMRQIEKVLFLYLEEQNGVNLSYAGNL